LFCNSEQDRLKRRSQAIQKSLPRPVNVKIAELPKNASIPQQLVHEELVRLLNHDSIAYPVPGGKIAPGVQKAQNGLVNIEDEFDTETLDQARQLLDEEVAQSLGVPAEEDVKKAIWDRIRADSNKFEDVWSKEHKDVLFSAEKMSFLTLDEFTDDKSKIAGLQKMLEVCSVTMSCMQ
jgi:pre-mRNA-splicing factor CDC5/CEF1